MEIRQHEWLSASPHEGFEQMKLKSRPKEPSPSLTRVGANFYSSVKQQDYSASVWLRRKDKLEHVRAARPGLDRHLPPSPFLRWWPVRAGRGGTGSMEISKEEMVGGGGVRVLRCPRLRLLHFVALLSWQREGVGRQHCPSPPDSPAAPRCRVHLHCVLGGICGTSSK
ncbi:Inactive phospholipase D5 [Fukomys damarensis]|uniref:Inactive phospholipase D5 n=1 Tax=Fukomys damarensis TaxID=885580 RepID=A0A091D031_FUKDA|nr:Inactive phospholipase D5 [Fukomys damarensis]